MPADTNVTGNAEIAIGEISKRLNINHKNEFDLIYRNLDWHLKVWQNDGIFYFFNNKSNK